MSEENEFLTRDNMRELASYILDQISVGDVNENLMQVGMFITNMLGGLLLTGAQSKLHAIEGLNAFCSDLEALLQENFDAAKADMNAKTPVN
jgi:hypothetical protein